MAGAGYDLEPGAGDGGREPLSIVDGHDLVLGSPQHQGRYIDEAEARREPRIGQQWSPVRFPQNTGRSIPAPDSSARSAATRLVVAGMAVARYR